MSHGVEMVTKSVSCRLFIGEPEKDKITAPKHAIAEAIHERIRVLTWFMVFGIGGAVLFLLGTSLAIYQLGGDAMAVQWVLAVLVPLVGVCVYLYPYRWSVWRRAWIINQEHLSGNNENTLHIGPAIEWITGTEINKIDYLFDNN